MCLILLTLLLELWKPMVADVDKQTKAKAKIQSITTIDEAKRILDALCDLGYDKILDTILK